MSAIWVITKAFAASSSAGWAPCSAVSKARSNITRVPFSISPFMPERQRPAPTVAQRTRKFHSARRQPARQARLCRHPRHERLPYDQRALAIHTPTIAGERTVGPEHPVARNRHRELVGGAGARHRAHGLRVADTDGEIRISLGDTGRDGLQRGPDLLLKRRAANVELEIDGARGILDKIDDTADEG